MIATAPATASSTGSRCLAGSRIVEATSSTAKPKDSELLMPIVERAPLVEAPVCGRLSLRRSISK
jgi:hypothetical protein